MCGIAVRKIDADHYEIRSICGHVQSALRDWLPAAALLRISSTLRREF